MTKGFIGLWVTAVAFLFLCQAGLAATFNVDTINDLIDSNPGDGVCQATGGVCSVRAAIMEANALAGEDSIDIPAGEYVLTIAGDDDAGAMGDLDVIGGTLNINGAGAGETVLDGNNMDRVFHQTTGTLRLNDLGIQGGVSNENLIFGGAIYVQGFSDQPADFELHRSRVLNSSGKIGGGIAANQWATLVIDDTLIEGNVNNDIGPGNAKAAAIYCQGCPITIDRCTFTSNGNALSGSIIEVENSAQLNMLNSTVSGNFFGAGIEVTNAHASIKFSTIVNNGAENLTFFSFDDSHVFEVGSTILQNDSLENCRSGDLPESLGYNVVGDATCAFSEAGDVENVDALLGSLGDNGGFTHTHLPQSGSPAISRVPEGSCTDLDGFTPLTIDQRDQERPLGPACEAGSTEVDVPFSFGNGFEGP